MAKKKMKAEKPKAKAAAPKKPKQSDLPQRELLEGVTAIVLKKGKVAVSDRQCVYETAGAYCVWDNDQRKRIHWIPRKRVLDIER
jgi:hypothetical protein